jgi:4-amino-4-deoxy-L-arabinose transferase-like glycosyltransferase
MRPRLGGQLAAVFLGVCLVVVVVWCVLLDLLPPISRDALIHHLAIPKLWLSHGGFVETPWATFSYYPMNLDLLYLLPLAAGYDVGAKLIHFAFGLGTAAIVYLYVRRRLPAPWALLGALLFLSTPAILRLCASAYVDLGLTFFITGSVICLFLWAETGKQKWFWISAVMVGLAAGTKYNGMIGIAFLTMGAAIVRSRQVKKTGSAIGAAALYALTALVVFSPWMIKNYMLTGNPIYPLYNNIFGLPNWLPPELQLSTIQIRHLLYKESWWEILLVPVRVFFQGVDHDPRLFDGVLNPILLIGPAVAVIRPRFSDARLLAALAVLWILTVFFRTSFIIRYIAPILPLLAILSVYGLYQIWMLLTERWSSIIASIVIIVVILASLFFNGSWVVDYWTKMDPLPYLTGQEDRKTYLSRRLPQYPAIDFINTHTKPDARILMLFAHNQGYYLDRDYFFYTYYSGESLRPILKNASDPDDILNGFKTRKVTHLFVKEALLADYLLNVWNKEKFQLWNRFSGQHLRRIFTERGYSVLEIIP